MIRFNLDPWVPHSVSNPKGSAICARVDCKEHRVVDAKGCVRRYCATHAAEWDTMCKDKGGADVIPLPPF